MARCIIAFIWFLCIAILPSPVGAASPDIVISEVAVESLNLSHEFIEIHNNSGQDILLEGWKIQVRSAAGSVSRTINLSKTIRPFDHALVASTVHPTLCGVSDFTCFSAGMTPAGGSVQVLNGAGLIVDTLGWGTATIGEGKVAPAPWLTVLSLQRIPGAANQLLDTDNNATDFTVQEQDPQYGGTYMPATVPAEPPACAGLIITEITPNPAGEDDGHEFVELFNPTTEAISLGGCSLRVGNANLPLEGTIEPGYHAFHGLTLPNSNGGVVELLSAAGTHSSVAYPANMNDDEAYGLIDGTWMAGLMPTPDAMNNTVTIAPTVDETTQTLEPCPPGKYRSPETNRCRNVEVTPSLTPCNSGQVRSAETNRCRAIASGQITAPCKQNEVRNTETNRCRKVATPSTQAACKAGQERNPETNRCRKVAAAKTTNPIKTPATTARPISYYALGIIGLLAVTYGIYEYRDVLQKLLLRRRHKE